MKTTRQAHAGVIVSAYYRIHPAHRDTFIKLITPDILGARQMEGCILYAFAEDVTEASVFHLTEIWTTEDAFRLHEDSAVFKTAVEHVSKQVRVLERRGADYVVSSQRNDDPTPAAASAV
jgi:quinol monooxygenase YgiN